MKPSFFCHSNFSCNSPFVLSGFVFIVVAVLSQPSYAVTAGCNSAKYTAMKDISEVRTAYDVGATEQTIPKPDSVLTLSCFSRASQVTAEKSGAIFSGDFKSNLKDTIQDTTDNMSSNFSGGLLDKYSVSLTDNWTSDFNKAGDPCDLMDRAWSLAQNDTITTDAEFMDMDTILATAGGAPSSGAIMDDNLQTVSGAATNAGNYFSAPPTAVPAMYTDTGGGSANGYLDTCDVVRNLGGGAAVAGCP